MTLELLARLGGLAAAGGLALLLLSRPRPVRLAGLGLWAVGLVFILPLLAPSGQGRLVAAGAVGLVVLGAGVAFLIRRVPWALPFLTLAAVPARVPVTIGDESATLLIPLYVIVAGAAAELAWSLWRDEPRSRELGVASWPLAVFVVWTAASAFWADDATEAAIDLFFFILPFTLLALALARLPWRDAAPAWLLGLLLGMAVLFAAVGTWQWAARDIFWNQKVIRGNENSVLFRVNSLFWDPSIYGRFLVLAILAALVVLVCSRVRAVTSRAGGAASLVVVAVLWVALVFTFSQSSFAALLAGLALLAVFTWGARGARALLALVVVAAAVALLAPPLERVRDQLFDPTSESVNRATRGRSDLVTKGLRIGAEHPVIGVGVGNFTSAYQERFNAGTARVPASHTTPVTVFAETGVVGLVLFGWLVVAVARLAFGPRRAPREPVRLTALVAAFGLTAIFVHALFYSAFLEDPMTWALVGLAALAAATGAGFAAEPRPAARAREFGAG
jgi:putative inorganic carbon (hco3(-)) transporter